MFRNGRWSFQFLGWVISRRQQESCPVLEVLRRIVVLGAIESLARIITPHQVRVESGADPADSVCCVNEVQKGRATYEALAGAPAPLKAHASAGGHAGGRTILVREFSHHRFGGDEQTSDRCCAL